jgi:hypothetical protein
MAHAHLTWAAWTERQARQIASAQYPAPMALGQKTLLKSVEYDTSARLTWPLPATLLPNARLTWTEWRAAQSKGLTASQPEQGALERAA